jgi:hypothetical protein
LQVLEADTTSIETSLPVPQPSPSPDILCADAEGSEDTKL